MQNTLKQGGYDAQIAYNSSINMYRVVASTYADKASAVQSRDAIRGSQYNPKSDAKIVDPEQMQMIQDRVYTYFGANEDVLRNSTVGDSWAAYYEGKIEPFAL